MCHLLRSDNTVLILCSAPSVLFCRVRLWCWEFRWAQYAIEITAVPIGREASGVAVVDCMTDFTSTAGSSTTYVTRPHSFRICLCQTPSERWREFCRRHRRCLQPPQLLMRMWGQIQKMPRILSDNRRVKKVNGMEWRSFRTKCAISSRIYMFQLLLLYQWVQSLPVSLSVCLSLSLCVCLHVCLLNYSFTYLFYLPVS